MRPSSLLATVLLLTGLAGCAASAVDLAPQAPDQPWTPRTDASGEILAGEPARTALAGAAQFVLPANSKVASVPEPPPQLMAGRIYSLAELIDIAESNNPETRVAWNNARSSALAAGIARSALLPKLTASALYGYQSSQESNTAYGANGSGRSTADGAISTLSLEWLLFDFGERRAILHAAEQASVISNIGFTAAHQQLIYAVSVSFYAYSAARARVESAAQALKNAHAVQTAAEVRYRHGIGTTVEVAEARQGTAQARLQQVQADGAAQNGYLALINAMGISPLTHLRIVDLKGRELPSATSDSLEQIVAQALGRRPDVLAAFAAQRASEDEVRAARDEFMPKFFLSGSVSYNSSHFALAGIPSIGQLPSTLNLSGGHLGGTVFAGVTIPVYDAGTRAAALDQARAAADNASLALTRTREDAVRQVVAAENALRTSLSAYHAASALSSATQVTFDAALAAYRSGVGSITDASLAQTQLLQARNGATDAYCGALSAAAGLALSAGTLGTTPAVASAP